MKLSTQDAAEFFNLMWSLQAYVNQRLAIVPDVASVEAYGNLPTSDKLAVRDALYDNIHLIDSFLEAAQGQISDEQREIVQGWKEFKQGDFFIERLLKKYAIFIGGDKVYGVIALYETFEEMLPYVRLPYYTKAVLLPFKGKLIYDGMLQGYSMSFGGGIKSNLKETYLAAKQNGRIIESFGTANPGKKADIKGSQVKDWSPTLNELLKQVKKLKSNREAPAIQSPTFSIAKASIELAKIAVETPDDLDELWKALKKVNRAVSKTAKVLNRMDY